MGTGYAITLDDFRQLVSDTVYQQPVKPLLKAWFDYAIEGAGLHTRIRSADGAIVDADALHQTIQADPKMQYELYQTAMSLWR
jgi:hypothetical protein